MTDRSEEEGVVEQSETTELVLSDQGYEVRDRHSPLDEPLAVFPSGEAGFEAAYEYFTRADRYERYARARSFSTRASFWLAVVSGLLWVVGTAIAQIRFAVLRDPFESQDAYRFIEMVSAIAQIGYAVFLVAFAAHVMLRLDERRR